MRSLIVCVVFSAVACKSMHDPSGGAGTDAGSGGKADDGSADADRPRPDAPHGDRADGAWKIPIALSHSIQNPCFSPDSSRLVVTNWIGGYNVEPAVVATVSVSGGTAHAITSSSYTSVNLPGSCWRGDRITYSSAHDNDEIYTNNSSGTDERQLTHRTQNVGYEPSYSPDGQWIVFESHPLDVEDHGAIYKVRADGSDLTPLTNGTGDDRQPNWSPAGDLILFQSHHRTGSNIDLWVMNSDGSGLRNVTQSPSSDDTDASFSPDGTRIVYSSNYGGLNGASLFVIPVAPGGTPTRLTTVDGYDGAPTWSPDGATIAFESSATDPDGGPGTQIWAIAAPP